MKKTIAVILSLVLLCAALSCWAETSVISTMAGLNWSFSSGAGAWSTDLQIQEDGSFTGEFHDSDMGDCTDEYPDGTVSFCSFSGQLSLVSQVDEKTWEIRIDELHTDLVVLAGCLVTIPEILIDTYENKIINIHPALIPSFCGKGYYGLKVHEAALKRGVKLSGATVHFVNKDLDAGPIILQKAVEVEEDDTPKTLQQRIMEQAEWKIMPKAIDLIANGKITVKDGHVIHQ
jgi:folate-dependent phosphoribosylglycinamide formyltransferase PurN